MSEETGKFRSGIHPPNTGRVMEVENYISVGHIGMFPIPITPRLEAQFEPTYENCAFIPDCLYPRFSTQQIRDKASA